MYRKMFLYVAAAVFGIVSAALCSAVFTITTVMGSGMEPAIESGSKVLINKLAYQGDRAEIPPVGSVIAFQSDVYGEEGEGCILVRRVAGTGGDTIEIKEHIFYLNGKPYEKHMAEAVNMEDMSKQTLGKNEIFVLSDNRKSSMDSRNEAIGILDVTECIGKVCFQ